MRALILILSFCLMCVLGAVLITQAPRFSFTEPMVIVGNGLLFVLDVVVGAMSFAWIGGLLSLPFDGECASARHLSCFMQSFFFSTSQHNTGLVLYGLAVVPVIVLACLPQTEEVRSLIFRTPLVPW